MSRARQPTQQPPTPAEIDAVWDALRATSDPYRLHLYIARVALQAAAEGDWHVYARLRKGLIASNYWAEDAATQISVPADT